MKKIKYDIDLMKYMSLFESLTRTKLKDCFFDNNGQLIFVVEENQIAKAIGKGGANAKKMENVLKKRIKIVEFNPDVKQFIRNLVYPLNVVDINSKGDVIIITGPDTKTKGLLIGRNSRNLDNLSDTVKRYFEVSSINVV
ncbi:NusA-like transcription termination signal-binding factor [Candidatus Woesearchaeota archaeon]|nr:NusA-like transcription termination signal-binding factor [Candidatus Woesearchaeota archaeon]